MNKAAHVLLLAALLSLASCASTPKINVAQVSGGAVVSIPNRGISVALPTGWQLAASQPADTLILAGAEGSALRFALVSPSGRPKNLNVESASFQKGVRDALAENGFTKLTRAELLNLSGVNAYFCAASASSKSESVMQVHLIHRGRPLLLVFYSTKKPVTQIASIKSILSSFQVR
jgi:hypothetical protein